MTQQFPSEVLATLQGLRRVYIFALLFPEQATVSEKLKALADVRHNVGLFLAMASPFTDSTGHNPEPELDRIIQEYRSYLLNIQARMPAALFGAAAGRHDDVRGIGNDYDQLCLAIDELCIAEMKPLLKRFQTATADYRGCPAWMTA